MHLKFLTLDVSISIKIVDGHTSFHDARRYSWIRATIDSCAVISILNVAVFITSITIVCIAIITVTKSCDAVSADVVAFWVCCVQEKTLVTCATLI